MDISRISCLVLENWFICKCETWFRCMHCILCLYIVQLLCAVFNWKSVTAPYWWHIHNKLVTISGVNEERGTRHIRTIFIIIIIIILHNKQKYVWISATPNVRNMNCILINKLRYSHYYKCTAHTNTRTQMKRQFIRPERDRLNEMYQNYSFCRC